METLTIPTLDDKGRVVSILVPLKDGCVGTAQIQKALKAREKPLAFMPRADFLAWLRRAETKNQVALSNLLQHLPPMLDSSVEMIAAAEVERLARPEPESLLVSYGMKPTDLFRKDLSVGPQRLAPEVIDYSVQTGKLDLFVRPARSMWDDKDPDYFEHQELVVEGEYREKLMADLRRANLEVLTGPEYVARGLPLPHSLERKIIPAEKVVIETETSMEIKTVPAHPRLMPWEVATMRERKRDSDVSLPNSPYDKQRPWWLEVV